MGDYRHISTGHSGIDAIVDGLRLGDNVVWQTDDVADFVSVVEPFVARAQTDGRQIIYFRFADHAPLLTEGDHVAVHTLDPSVGFEGFAASVYRIITDAGVGAFYVFDSLSSLVPHWGSDLMVMNFFKVTCPYLYELDTIAYFCLLRGEHSFDTIAGIRETTQLLLDLHHIREATYVHPHKAWGRYSPTMFFPHRVDSDSAVPVTSSAETSELFGRIGQQVTPIDPWHSVIESAREALSRGDEETQRTAAVDLLGHMFGREGRMVELASQHLTLENLIGIADRKIGSGFIGGKSVGMLTAGAIAAANPALAPRLEAHDSFYIGSDLFFTYIIANGWWKIWMEQKSGDGYYRAGADLHDKLLTGTFPPVIRERFLRLLEYFGQSPIIARSSSLLEDNFGNAFSGKYESVFCANQGTPDDRLRSFEDAVRQVYASALGDEALHYREHRGLTTDDEQMAVLVQRVSGDHHGDYFFPHAGGVGNSRNLYVFSSDIDPEAGALRVVTGLGTRAVDRLSDDYARVVTLDHPLRATVDSRDTGRYSQKKMDVLSLAENRLTTITVQQAQELGVDWSLFMSADHEAVRSLRERGLDADLAPLVCDFAGLLRTEFPGFLRDVLSTLEETYDYPVDIEFTVNLTSDGDFRVCLVQCRPLQTQGVGAAVSVPEIPTARQLLTTAGNFMGGNRHLDIDYVLHVRPEAYLQLDQQSRYEVARTIGAINRDLRGHSVMAIGPGRWGTTTTSLGVPVRFAEISNVTVLVEATEPSLDFSVELSFGSHFFLDLVESGIFYAAVDQFREDASFAPELLAPRANLLTEHVPDSKLEDVIHLSATPGLTLYSDILSQRLVAGFPGAVTATGSSARAAGLADRR